MEFVQVIGKTAIPNSCGSKYKGVAFDGCYFYFTCPDTGEIVKCDLDLAEVARCKTLKPYVCICYDPCEGCFWASSNLSYDKIFRLDCCLREIDCVTVHPSEHRDVAITGVSYDCAEARLLVSFAHCVVAVTPGDCPTETILQKSGCATNLGVLALPPCILLTELREAQPSLAVYGCDFSLQLRCDLPCGYTPETLLFDPCRPGCDGRYHFYLLATKNGSYSYMLACTLDGRGLALCDCNYRVCDTACRPPCRPSATGCAELIESIALIEASLSQILHAEGEKLQKIIACAENLDEILCANEAVRDTIVRITHLEILLHDKLALIERLCRCCEMPPCPPENP